MDAFDYAVIVYLALHIPTTLLVDAQCVLPREWYPDSAAALLQWQVHAATLVSAGSATYAPRYGYDTPLRRFVAVGFLYRACLVHSGMLTQTKIPWWASTRGRRGSAALSG